MGTRIGLYLKNTLVVLLFCAGGIGCVAIPNETEKPVVAIPIYFHASLPQELVDLIGQELAYARIFVVEARLEESEAKPGLARLEHFPLVIANYLSSSDASLGKTKSLYTFRSEVDLCLLVNSAEVEETSNNAFSRCRKYLPLGDGLRAKLQQIGSHTSEFVQGDLQFSNLQQHASKIHQDIAKAIARHIVQNIGQLKNISPI